MTVKRYFVNVTQDDIEDATGKSISDCMIHRAIMRAVGKDFHSDQVQVSGHDDLGFFIQILSYEHVLYNKQAIGNPHLVDAERQWVKHRERLATAPYWNRQVNPKGFFMRLGERLRRGTTLALGREDINQACWFWDNGYTVKPFTFAFTVELRPEWDYHQMDLFQWWEERGIDTGQELVKMVDEAQLAERLGVMEEPALVLVA